MKKIIVIGLILLISGLSQAQIVDNYGIRIGGGFSNQYWELNAFSNLSDWKDNKLSLSIYLNAEKELTDFLSIRPEIGYLQKGYVENIIFTSAEGDVIHDNIYVNKNVILHNLSGDIGLKISPFNFVVQPYLIVGVRADYMLDYKGAEIKVNEKTVEITDIIKDYNKFTLSGLIGIGLEYQNMLYLDIEFNPALSKNYDNKGISIKDRYIGATIGVNMNALIQKNK